MNGIGGNTIAAVESNISKPELVQWLAYRQLYPWPVERLELANGMQTLWLVSAMAGKSAKKLKASDVMVSYPLEDAKGKDLKPDPGSWEALQAMMAHEAD